MEKIVNTDETLLTTTSSRSSSAPLAMVSQFKMAAKWLWKVEYPENVELISSSCLLAETVRVSSHLMFHVPFLCKGSLNQKWKLSFVSKKFTIPQKITLVRRKLLEVANLVPRAFPWLLIPQKVAPSFKSYRKRAGYKGKCLPASRHILKILK